MPAPSIRHIGLSATVLLCGCGRSEEERRIDRMAVEAPAEIDAIHAKVSDYARTFGHCPGGVEGSTAKSPPTSVDCGASQMKLCIPGGEGPASYPWTVWSEPLAWRDMTYVPGGPHAYHYRYAWRSIEGGCQFTVQAFGDLDSDGVFSTYERAGRESEKKLQQRELKIADQFE